MRAGLMVLMTLMSLEAWAYKLAIYTDEPGGAKAQEIKSFISSTYPFNQYELEFVVVPVPESRLKCKHQSDIVRNVSCDTEEMAIEASKSGIDQVFVVKDSKNYGGSGGSIPVVTSSTPAAVMLHEYMHALGFCDEYEYAASESKYYCKETGINMAIIEPIPTGYSNDREARSKHSGEIPWYSFIKEHVTITHDGGSKLGTGTVNSSVFAGSNQTNKALELAPNIGLYQGKTCKNATPPKKTWQPGAQATIMEFSEAGLGNGNELLVMKVLDSKGVPRKNPPPTDVPISVNSSEFRTSKELSSSPKDEKHNSNFER